MDTRIQELTDPLYQSPYYKMHETTGLAERLENANTINGVSAGHDCLFISDADSYTGYGPGGLSTDQYGIVQLTDSVTQSEIGRILADGSISYDPQSDTVDPTLVCVNNTMPQLGFFSSREDLINIKFEQYGFDPETQNIYGQNSLPAILTQEGPLNTDAMNTYLEELAHGYQTYILGNSMPDYEDTYHPADEKTWDLATEAQAKVMGAVGIVQYELETGKNVTGPYIQEFYGTVEAEMVKNTKSLYDHHGAEFMQENPEYLAPVFETFFQHEGSLESYYAQGADFINGLDSLDRVSIDRFEQAFGQIPGFKGSMLDGRYETIEDLADLMPEGTMKSFLQESFEAAHNGEIGPQIDVPDQPGPSNTQIPASPNF